MDAYQDQTDNYREAQQDSIRTFVYSDLPEREKEKFMEFMIKNNVEFVMDDDGNYIATISFVLSNSNQQKVESKEISRESTNKNLEHQQQKYTESNDNFAAENKEKLLKEQYIETVEDIAAEQPANLVRNKSGTSKQSKKSDNQRSARGARSKSPLVTAGTSPSSNLRPSVSPRPQLDHEKPKPLPKRKQTVESYDDYENLLKLVGSIAGLRAK